MGPLVEVSVRGILTAAGVLLVAASLLGCGGDDETTVTVTAEATDTTDMTATTDTTTTTPTTTDTTTTTPTTTTTEPTTVLGSAEATLADVPVRADITELTREGEFATLNFTVTNLAPRASSIIYRSFDDTTHGTAADGLLLIDPRNGKEYRVVRNPGQGCLCSDEIPSTLGPRATMSLFATFEAPPLSASRVHVSFPGSLGTITGVPLD